MGKPIIEIKDFSYRYSHDSPLVLKNITATIEEGDLVGIIGCNKAGKSTLCKAMVGIVPFVAGGDWSGEIVVDGKSLNDTKGEGATDIIGIVFQDAESQFTQSTVEDEIAFAMCNFGYDRKLMQERVAYAAKACDVYDLLDRSPYELSGGQQQRLAVASILALQPRVIILDESTSQLDPIGRDKIFKIVRNLHDQGKTCIMVDHNIEKIAEIADKVLVLHDGDLVIYDEKHKVFSNKKVLNDNFVRIPQVTDAAIGLRETCELGEDVPIDMNEAIHYFSPLITKGKANE